VEEFPYVFPYDLLGMPLERDVEFVIDGCVQGLLIWHDAILSVEATFKIINFFPNVWGKNAWLTLLDPTADK
jgi:hypothetical protein